MKKAAKILTVSALLLGVGYTSVEQNLTPAQAKKVSAARVKSYKNTAKKTVHFQKGTLYSNARLTKAKANMKKYKHTTFYTSKQAKVVKSNHKKAVYLYVKSGKTKGWVWNGYAKKGKAPKATTKAKPVVYTAKSSSKTISASAKKIANSKNSFGLKKGYTSKKMIKKYFKDHMNNLPKTSIPGTNIKVKKNSIHVLNDATAYVIATNGNRVYFKPTSKTTLKYSMEVLPGLHSPKSNFTNNTGHWVVYMVSGNGVKPTATHSNAAGDNKGNIAAPVKGFKYLPDLYDGLYAHMPSIDTALEGNAAQYNYSKKIMLITPKVIGVNSASTGQNLWGN